MDATGGDHRNAAGVGQGHGGFDVAALHHAVLGDVGVDDRRDAIGLETARQIHGLHAADLGPAVGGDETVLGIQADDDLARKRAAGLADEFRLLDRLGADDHVADAGAHVVLDGFQRANAAADLDRQIRVAPGDRGDHLAIDRLALEGAVQIDQVQAAAAGLDPLGGHGHRVVGEYRGVVHQALTQTHAGAVLEIDRGNNQHGSNLFKSGVG